jgi:hypothetical protein
MADTNPPALAEGIRTKLIACLVNLCASEQISFVLIASGNIAFGKALFLAEARAIRRGPAPGRDKAFGTALEAGRVLLAQYILCRQRAAGSEKL